MATPDEASVDASVMRAAHAKPFPGADHSVTPETHALLKLLIQRRTRRAALGAKMPKAGPLGKEEDVFEKPSESLELWQEAALVFAACGITGPILAELPFHHGKD